MKTPAVEPRDQPRDFRTDEMFFSTTDSRGIITAGNGVFCRISGYPVDELIGRAHNIIRHPDMPRCAFRLVWDTLKQSRRTAALVKNLAKDGRYYWVVALFAPARDGYLSIRFKPTGPLVDVVAEVYALMLAEEERQLAAGADETAAMAASEQVLVAALRQRGFADYDTFMRALLCEELKSRDATLAREGLVVIRPLPESSADASAPSSSGDQLRSLYRRGAAAYLQLSRLFVRLDEFGALQQSLNANGSFVSNLTSELRLAATNASLASTRVGGEGLSLAVVSDYMGKASADVAGCVDALTDGIRTVSRRLRSVIFNLAAGRLQIEMTMTFLHELISASDASSARQSSPRSIRALQQAFGHSLKRAVQSLDELASGTKQLDPTSNSLGRHMLELQVAQLSGQVETTRLREVGDFTAVFAQIRELIENTREQLTGLSEAIAHLDEIASEAPIAMREIAALAADMEAEAAVLQEHALPAAAVHPKPAPGLPATGPSAEAVLEGAVAMSA
ncbi:MAG: PAS domain S-box protein [Verrucomicrobia bacterium]|nr:PAS domain S-box protein [Verrucomicrobiota bacterium]